jgi:transposase
MFVGIDIGLERDVSHFMVADGDSLGRLIFPNDLEGGMRFIDRTVELANQAGVTKLRIGMEATGLYWWHLQQLIDEAPQFAAFDVQTAVLNPKVVEKFKGIYTDIPKTDDIDAWVIADCLRFGRVRFYPPPDPRYAPLQRLTRFRYWTVENVTREKNRALSLLFLRFSTFAKQAPFSNVFGKASAAIFTELTVEQVATTPLEELVEFLAERSRGHLPDPAQAAAGLKRAAKNAYRLNPKMDDAVGVALSMSVATVRFLEQQIARIDKVIERELEALPQALDTIPGIGPVYSAGIVSEIGDIHRFPNHNALAKYEGLTWRQHQSGNFAAEDIPLTRSGNFFLRYYMIEAANRVRVRDPEYAAFYERKYTEARHHQHKRALVLTARKLTRLVFTLLSEGQIYQPRRRTP